MNTIGQSRHVFATPLLGSGLADGEQAQLTMQGFTSFLVSEAKRSKVDEREGWRVLKMDFPGNEFDPVTPGRL
jgi:hypothetical protein